MELQALIQSRDALIRSVKRLLKIAKTAKKDPKEHENFKTRFLDLETTNAKFEQTQAKIEAELIEANKKEDVDSQSAVWEQFEEIVYDIKSLYRSVVPDAQSSTHPVSQLKSTNVRLPELVIPKFSGDFASWYNFADIYRSLIHDNDSLSPVEKFYYLRLNLSGEPLNLIKNLLVTAGNYPTAWSLLENRYEHKRLIATQHVEKILALPNISAQSITSLKPFLNTIVENIEALKVLKLPVTAWTFMLSVIILKKLDLQTRRQYELTLNDCNTFPAFTDLLDFLERQLRILESLPPNQNNSHSATTSQSPRYRPAASVSLVSSKYTPPRCVVCPETHFAYFCPIFKSKSPRERFNIVKQYNLCVNCLGPSHNLSSCPSVRSCSKCNNRHHSLLHFSDNNSQSSGFSNAADHRTESGPGSATLSTFVHSERSVLLATALVHVLDSQGFAHTVRALLDSASQATYITESCLQQLHLKRQQTHISIHGLGNMPVSQARGVTSCTLRPRGHTTPSFVASAIVVPRITGIMPNRMLPHSNYFAHLNKLNLADPNYNSPSRIDMLIGADLFPYILQGGRYSGPPGSPVALETVFGWVLMGELSVPQTSLVHTLHLAFDNSAENCSLDVALKRFWEVEEVTVPPPVASPEETRCESVYCDTVRRDSESGRYSVALPFRNFPPALGNSYAQALRCYTSLQRRLNHNPRLKTEYSAFMQDYIDTGHMSLVLDPDTKENNYFIPHHCVLKPESPTTKLRVVFNASMKTTTNISLNDTLLPGPALQQDLVAILLRFRFRKFVITADVRQMYRQILIHPYHRCFQRILWNPNPNQSAHVYELNTVTYGMNCAPYLALRTLRQLALDEGHNYPTAAHVISHCTYIDDIITGCDTLSDAVALQKELSELFASGGFELRKWSTNDARTLINVPDSYKQAVGTPLDLDRDLSIKVLGLRWNPNSDFFSYKTQSLEPLCTKRKILSEVAKIFDPLGWLSPITMFAKRLIQLLWTLSLDWDAEPPSEIVTKWKQFQEELVDLSKCTIFRYIPTGTALDLIGFCDASEAGYAAVVYSRSSNDNSPPHIALLCAKSRVSPLKRLTLARLELCAAVLLARVVEKVIGILSFPVREIYVWSDSTVALTWITSSPHRWKTFISNRVTEIQSVLAPKLWRHVKSADNPADCASRGLLARDLVNHNLWWHGPDWLTAPPSEWPGPQHFCNSAATEEISSETSKLTLITRTESSFDLLEKYTSLFTLLRITAYCFKFYTRCRTKLSINSPFLTTIELENALNTWIRLEQSSAFHTEIVAVRRNRPCARYLQKLNPFMDKNGILRVGGRLRHALITFEQKYPILLPQRSRLTRLIITHYHRLYLHPGPQTLQAILGRKFWIVSARNVIRHELSKCYECFRSNPTARTPLMGDLPSTRITRLKPFQTAGVDYGGPFTISYARARGIKTHKAYLCLFVCFSTKAVHLELASNLSTDAFLAAFRRFVARRGRCSHMYSDCGTNFVGAKRKLSELNTLLQSQHFHKNITNALSVDGVKWHFNPPSSPHFGGLWEAGIKSVKKHLVRIVGDRILTYEEFNTVIIQIEAILNSRPLCPVSSDPNDLTALTPGHFLVQEPLIGLPDEDVTSTNPNRLSRWQLVQQIQQHFWNRWHREYLNTLQQRKKWLVNTAPLSDGQLVLIKDELLPPLRWKTGRVISTIPGPDGVVRVAKIRTAAGTCLRPVVKLCPFPDGSISA